MDTETLSTTDLADQARLLARLIPPARWSTFGDIAEALDHPGEARGVSRALTGLGIGGAHPAHRIRMDDGRMVSSSVDLRGSSRVRSDAEREDISDTLNAMYRAEGGVLTRADAIAYPYQRMTINELRVLFRGNAD